MEVQGMVRTVNTLEHGGVGVGWSGNTLSLENAADFPRSGGQFTIEGDPETVYTYTDVTEGETEDDPDTITTVEAAPSGLEEEFRVTIYPVAYTTVAEVATPDAIEDSIPAVVPHDLKPYLVDGGREVGTEESVLIDARGWEWVVTDILDQPEVRIPDVVESVRQAQADAQEAVNDAGEALQALAETPTDLVLEYAVSPSETSPPSTGWSTDTPTRTPGTFVWMRTRVTRGNGTVEYSAPSLSTGNTGAPGESGRSVSSVDVEYYLSTSPTALAGGSWQTTPPPWTAGRYYWTRTVTTYTSGSPDTTDPVNISGPEGQPGGGGSDGRGVDSVAEQYYLSTSSTALAGGSWVNTPPPWVAGRFYWTRSVVTYTDSTSSTTDPIMVSGQKGDVGAPGRSVTGVDVEYYLSTSATAVTGGSWVTTPPPWTAGRYMWTRTVTTYSSGSPDTTDPVSISGSPGQPGADGDHGDDGRGITSVVEQYYLSTSSTTQTGGTWQTTPPAPVPGRYYWTRSVITYTDSATTSTDPIMVTGAAGDPGAPGRSVTSVDVWYYLSTSATSLVGGTWATTAPTWTSGRYMWTKTVTTYSSGSPTESDPANVTGQQGQPGTAGRGITSVVEQYYLSTSSTTQTGGSWVGTPPAWVAGRYYWTRSVITYTDTTTATTDPVMVSGAQGNTGPQGVSITGVTSFYALVTAGTTPTQPTASMATPPSPWQATEPAYTAGMDLWRVERITYSNGTRSYTTIAKSSAYAAALHVANLAEAATQGLVKFSQTDPGHYPGRIWWQLDSAGGGIGIKISNGSTWQSYTIVADQILVPSSVGAIQLKDGAVTAGKIAATAFEGETFTGGTFTGLIMISPEIRTSTTPNRGLRIVGDTLATYSNTGDQVAQFSPSGAYVPNLWMATGTARIAGVPGGLRFYMGSSPGLSDGLLVAMDEFTGDTEFISHSLGTLRGRINVRPGRGIGIDGQRLVYEGEWSTLSLLSGYTAGSEGCWYKVRNGFVYLSGLVTRNAGNFTSAYVDIATLPIWARPTKPAGPVWSQTRTTGGGALLTALVSGAIRVASAAATDRIELSALPPFPVDAEF